jgi:prephenate dehydrogenase
LNASRIDAALHRFYTIRLTVEHKDLPAIGLHMNTPTAKKTPIAVVGMGLIGASVALACRKYDPTGDVCAWDNDVATRDWLKKNLSDISVSDDLQACVSNANLVIVAVPPPALPVVLTAILDATTPQCVVTDTCSVKLPVAHFTHSLEIDARQRYVPAHPIAGGQAKGPLTATGDLFVSRPTIICPLAENLEEHIATVQMFWQSIGSVTHRFSAAEHDQIYASVSHLPHFLAFAFSSLVAQSHPHIPIAALAGRGFFDFARNGGAQPELWADICIGNRVALTHSLERFVNLLNAWKQMLVNADEPQLKNCLLHASNHYKQLITPDNEGKKL